MRAPPGVKLKNTYRAKLAAAVRGATITQCFNDILILGPILARESAPLAAPHAVSILLRLYLYACSDKRFSRPRDTRMKHFSWCYERTSSHPVSLPQSGTPTKDLAVFLEIVMLGTLSM